MAAYRSVLKKFANLVLRRKAEKRSRRTWRDSPDSSLTYPG